MVPCIYRSQLRWTYEDGFGRTPCDLELRTYKGTELLRSRSQTTGYWVQASHTGESIKGLSGLRTLRFASQDSDSLQIPGSRTSLINAYRS